MIGYAEIPPIETSKELADLVYNSCRFEKLSLETALGKLYSILNIHISEGFKEERPFDAIIMPSYKHGGFQIIYDKNHVKKRAPKGKNYEEHLNFVLLHEIGHTFFFDKRKTPPRRLPKRDSDKEERFCDEFANSLLKLLTGK